MIGTRVVLQAAIGVQELPLRVTASLRKMLAQEATTSVLQMAALAVLLAKALELVMTVGLVATVAKVSR